MKNISSSNLFLSLLDVLCDSGYDINHACEANYGPCEFNRIGDVEVKMTALRYLVRNGLMCLISTDDDGIRRSLINRIGISFGCQPAGEFYWSKYTDLLLLIKELGLYWQLVESNLLAELKPVNRFGSPFGVAFYLGKVISEDLRPDSLHRLTLRDFARITIRKAVGGVHFQQRLAQLPLPKQVKEFVIAC